MDAQYMEIAKHYRERIENGELAPGDKLPTYRELTALWGIARPTAGRVMRQLAEWGLTESATSRGGTSVAPLSRASLLIPLNHPEVRVGDVGIASATPESASEFGVEPGCPVLIVELIYPQPGPRPSAGDGELKELPEPSENGFS